MREWIDFGQAKPRLEAGCRWAITARKNACRLIAG